VSLVPAGSDLNEAYVQAPVTPGHEFIGEVVKLGRGESVSGRGRGRDQGS